MNDRELWHDVSEIGPSPDDPECLASYDGTGNRVVLVLTVNIVEPC